MHVQPVVDGAKGSWTDGDDAAAAEVGQLADAHGWLEIVTPSFLGLAFAPSYETRGVDCQQ